MNGKSVIKTLDFRLLLILQDELFIWENARLTAEAFIHVYYNEMGRTIAEKQFYVAGYGRVGKMVADVTYFTWWRCNGDCPIRCTIR